MITAPEEIEFVLDSIPSDYLTPTDDFDPSLVVLAPELSFAQRSSILSLLTSASISSVFSKFLPDGGIKGAPPFSIELLPGFVPPRCYPRRVSAPLQEYIDSEIQKLLDLGFIRPSAASSCCPVHIANANAANRRMVIDYTPLNLGVKCSAAPIVNMKSLAQFFKGLRFIWKIDFSKGYWQCLMDPGSIPLTAFVTAHGLYEWTRLAFGHKNAPQYFAPVVRALLDPCIRAKQCVCYFEDVAGGGETFEAMLASLSAVLTLLAAHDVRINLSKCMFGFSELVYTGFAVSAQGHRLASSRLDPILNYPSNPQTLSQCRRLNGLIIQLSSYIANFSLISKPI